MCESDGWFGVRRKEMPVCAREPVEHGIGRRHGGQRHVETIRRAGSNQAMGEHHCGLGLAAAGLVLDDEQRWPGRQIDTPRPPLHRAWRRFGANQLAIVEVVAGCRRQHTCFPDRPQCPFLGVVPICFEALNRLAVREPLLIRSNPVREYGKAGDGERCAPRVPGVHCRNVLRRSEQTVRLPDEFVRGVDPR